MKRRDFLQFVGLASLSFSAQATRGGVTPSQAEGPFYPVTPIPLRSNLIVDSAAVNGEPMQLSGRVLDEQGDPMPGIKVEIWQCDGAGLYLHPRQQGHDRFDSNFAGSGAVLTGGDGAYAFSTLYPVPYTGRPPHIHVKLHWEDQELLTTQLYLRGQIGHSWFSRGRESLQIDPRKNGSGTFAAGYDFVV